MIIVACSCGHAITGDDRDAMIEATSEHLRKSPLAMTMMGAQGEHFALVGTADAKITLTTAVDEFPSRIIRMSGPVTQETVDELRERMERGLSGSEAP